MGLHHPVSLSRPSLLILSGLLATVFGADQEPGLVGECFAFDHGIGDFQDFAGLRPTAVHVDSQISFSNGEELYRITRILQNYQMRWSGSIKVAKDGDYTFITESDDGSRLFIDDRQVVDSGGTHAMAKKPGQVHLATGEHRLRFEYFQGAGDAGCRLYWVVPGGSETIIPGDVLSHDRGADTAIAWDKAAWNRRPHHGNVGWFLDMDFGSVLCDTITAAEPAGNLAIKGHAALLTFGTGDQAVTGGMCFDADLMRMSAGWTGGFLELKGVAYDGAHGVPGPQVAGTQIFGTPPLPGWSKNTRFDDPRREPFGPLPADLAKFKGQYMNGGRVVFAYTVGTGTVLESPGFEAAGQAVSRTLHIADIDAAYNLVAELQDGQGVVAGNIATLGAGARKVTVALVGAPAGVSLEVVGARIVMKIAAVRSATFKLVICHCAGADANTRIAAAAAAAMVEPGSLVAGGAARYPETVETRGVLGVAPEGVAYAVDTITVPEGNPFNSKLRFTGFDFFSDGRAAVSTWNGDVWVVSGIDDRLEKLTWKRFAAGLHQPLGLKIVDDVIHVTTRDGIERLVDLNRDGEADLHQSFNNHVHTSGAFHEFAFDLWTDPQGNFYYAKAGPVHAGGGGWEHITESSGCMFKVTKDGSGSEVFATGFRAPNGMSVGPHGEVTCGDNEGTWTPSSRINLVQKGGFYGVPPLSHRTPVPTDYDKPLLWLPHNSMVDNSSGGQAWVIGSRWGLPEGSLLHLSYGTSSLFLISWSKEGAVPQGGCVRFPLAFNTGIMRARFNPKDGQLYVCGMRGWQTNGNKDAGFQRVRYTGKTVHMPVGYKIKKNGLSLTFSAPLDRSSAAAKDNYSAEAWNYLWTENYGSPEVHLDDPKKKGHDPFDITAVTLSADARTVFLEIPGIRPAMQMKLRYEITAADGAALQADFYSTINQVGDTNGP